MKLITCIVLMAFVAAVPAARAQGLNASEREIKKAMQDYARYIQERKYREEQEKKKQEEKKRWEKAAANWKQWNDTYSTMQKKKAEEKLRGLGIALVIGFIVLVFRIGVACGSPTSSGSGKGTSPDNPGGVKDQGKAAPGTDGPN
jgi:hypothetical protein